MAGKELQADRKGQADPQRDREIRPDIDDSFSDIGPCYGHNALARRDHLAHVGAHGRNDSGKIGLHLRITKLLERLREVCLRASDRCLGAGTRLHRAV